LTLNFSRVISFQAGNQRKIKDEWRKLHMSKKSKFISLVLALIFVLTAAPPILIAPGAQVEATPAVYEFTIERTWLTMKDGVRLSATFFKPVPRQQSEKFPVLFEFLP